MLSGREAARCSIGPRSECCPNHFGSQVVKPGPALWLVVCSIALVVCGFDHDVALSIAEALDTLALEDS